MNSSSPLKNPPRETTPRTAEVWISRQEWKARMLNEIFRTQGVTGKPGKITASDVKHGEEKS